MLLTPVKTAKLYLSSLLKHPLTNWSLFTPIRDLLDWVSQELRSSYPMYCTDGGFASNVISQWILARLLINIPNGKIAVIPNPEKINMTGLRWLDKEVDSE